MNNKLIYISFLALAVLSACHSSKKAQSAENSASAPPQRSSSRLSFMKQREFDKYFFDGVNDKISDNYQRAADDFKKAVDVDPESGAAWYELGNTYLRLQQLSDAEQAAGKAVKLDEKNTWYKLLQADIYKYEKKWPEATAVYEKLVDDNPDVDDYYFELAGLYLYQNKPDAALKTYDRIEKHFGLSEDVSLQKHRIYFQQGKYDKAEEEINKLIKSNPNNPKYYEILAETYAKAGQDDKAMAVYNDLLKKNPDDGMAQLSMADYYYKKGDKKQSFEWLTRAFNNKSLSIDAKIGILYNNYLMQPKLSDEDKANAYALAEALVKTNDNDAKSHAIYGDLLYQDKRFEEARTQYRKSLEYKKDVFAVWQQLIFTESELKDNKAMAEESEKAMDYFPNQPLLYFFNGVANIEQKNYKKAVNILEAGLNQNIENPALEGQFYTNLAEAYYRLGDNSKSDSYFEKALAKDPNNALALNNYAYYLSVRNDELPKAEEMSKRSLDKEPDNASYLDTYGWILYKEGKYDQAADYIKKSLDKDPKAAEVNEHYGDVQYKLGNKDTALEYWKLAKKYGSDSKNIDKKISDRKLYE